MYHYACSTNDLLLLFSFFFCAEKRQDKHKDKKLKGRRLSKKKQINQHHQLNFPHNIKQIISYEHQVMGSSGGEKSAKKAKKEKRGDKPESGGGSSKKRGRDGLPVPSTPGDEDEDTKLNPVCAIASPLADGKLTKKALKVVKKGTRVLFFFVQQRGERRRRFFFSALLAF